MPHNTAASPELNATPAACSGRGGGGGGGNEHINQRGVLSRVLLHSPPVPGDSDRFQKPTKQPGRKGLADLQWVLQSGGGGNGADQKLATLPHLDREADLSVGGIDAHIDEQSGLEKTSVLVFFLDPLEDGPESGEIDDLPSAGNDQVLRGDAADVFGLKASVTVQIPLMDV